MKSKLIFMLLLCTVFLTACSNETPANIETTHSEAASSGTETVQYIRENYDYYQDGMVFGNYDSNYAMFVDFDTLEKAPLCAKPNCSHNSHACVAYVVGTTPVLYDNHAYYFTSVADVRETPDGSEFYIDSKLMRVTLNSSEAEVVCEFDDCAPGYPGKYLLAESELYFIGDDLGPSHDDYGIFSWSNSGGSHFLCSIDLNTGEYTNYGSIYDGDKEYEFAAASSGADIVGWYNGKMYVRYSFMKEDPKVLGIAPEENWTHMNFEFDINTKEQVSSQLPAALYTDQNTYVYLDTESRTTKVLINDTMYDIPRYDLYSSFVRVANNKVFFSDCWYDLTDLSEHSLGEYENPGSVTYYDGHYVLINGGRIVRLTEEELRNL